MNMYQMAALGVVVSFAIAGCDTPDSGTRIDRQDASMTQSADDAEEQKRIAESEFAAMEDSTEQNRRDLLTARTDAEFAAAKQLCEKLAGNEKDVCIKEAERAHADAMTELKLSRAMADANETARETTVDARDEAADTMQDADYGLAMEKCDDFAGDLKDDCVEQAKADFAQN